MSTKADVQADNKLDTVKWLIFWSLLGAGVVGFYQLPIESTLVRVLILLTLFGGAVFVVSQTAKGRFALKFSRDTQLEVRKVVWPSRKEVIQTTLIVIAMVIVMALMIWIVDRILFWIVQTATT